MTLRHYEWEGREYRAPESNPGQMELRNPVTKQWERYRGDPARVIMEATHIPAKGQR